MCVQDWRCMCTGVEVYLHKNEDVCAWEWKCVCTRMKMYGLECGGMCIEDGRCMCITVEVCTQEWRCICMGVEVCVHKNEDLFAREWRHVYIRANALSILKICKISNNQKTYQAFFCNIVSARLFWSNFSLKFLYYFYFYFL